jgi:ABC-type sugar transport system ATPase subunit
MIENPLLRLTEISKSFGGVQALSKVSLTADCGEVHAIIGENGAGKSTLMKIIAGALRPDSGRVEWEGKQVELREPRDASRLGIAIVYQEPVFFNELSVLENLYLGEELRTPTGAMDWARMTQGAKEALERMDLPVDIIGKPIADLTLGVKQLVLIARAIHRQARLLILDEPTAILSDRETEILFKTIRKLKQDGVSILYISHRLAEIFQIADRLSVLRDGKLVLESSVKDATQDSLINAMTGRKISADVYHPRPYAQSAPLLEVEHLSRMGNYTNVSFTVRPGEIVGFYGLVGAGRSEVVKAVYGEMPADEGTIRYKNQVFQPHSSRDAIRKGIIYVPEDRRQQGLFPIRSILDNISASMLRSLTRVLGFIDPKREFALAEKESLSLNIKASSLEAMVSSLSGGNQQKVVLGRGLTLNPQVLILDEPTHGIDVGTKNEIHKLIMNLADQGIAIILITSDLPEVLALADNFVVMHEGRMMGMLSREQATEENILRLALGLNSSESRVDNESLSV